MINTKFKVLVISRERGLGNFKGLGNLLVPQLLVGLWETFYF